ncbi:hypothetical protein [Tenacibaculum geojense]|uniref:Lipoprotein n=1 Tax=Tenacibaculum geojense TaxID=915352 RepID=A0ABW3JRA5_9FLAO
MKQLSKILLLIISSSIISCETISIENGKMFSTKTVVDTSYNCNSDSITVNYLKKATLDQALSNCQLTINNSEFILGEYDFMEPRKDLYKYFTNKDFNKKSIVIKEITWETKNGLELIQVWYKQNKNLWKPINACRYKKV